MRSKISLACVLLLLFVWSLPGMTALRHVLLLTSLLLLWPIAADRLDLRESLRRERWPALVFFVFIIWLVFQALFISPETSWVLGELRSQWIATTVALAVGILLAANACNGKPMEPAAMTTALAGVLLLQALIVIGHSIGYWAQHGELLRMIVPLTGGRLEMSFVLNILLSMLTTDLILRVCRRDALLLIPLWAVLAALAAALGAAYIAGARNSLPGVAFLAIATLVLLLTERGDHVGQPRMGVIAIVVVTLTTGFVFANYEGDPRWKVFAESATMGWDIDNHKAWINIAEHPLPLLQNGENADHSAFMRAAFLHAGLRVMGEYPLGVGYGRNAFAHALRIDLEDEVHVGHAHSGIIDFAVGGGIPAVALWLVLTASLVVSGLRRYIRDRSAHGLLLALIALGYTGRMVIDSVNRDHMLQMFMFLAGYLLMVAEEKESRG